MKEELKKRRGKLEKHIHSQEATQLNKQVPWLRHSTQRKEDGSFGEQTGKASTVQRKTARQHPMPGNRKDDATVREKKL